MTSKKGMTGLAAPAAAVAAIAVWLLGSDPASAQAVEEFYLDSATSSSSNSALASSNKKEKLKQLRKFFSELKAVNKNQKVYLTPAP